MASTSVNSVVCNHSQGRNQERLIVASNIDIRGTSGRRRIEPQNSTLMPDIPGLIPLLYLLFAPTVQLFKGQVPGLNNSQNIKLRAGIGKYSYSKAFTVTLSGSRKTATGSGCDELHDATVDIDIEITEADRLMALKIRKQFPRQSLY